MRYISTTEENKCYFYSKKMFLGGIGKIFSRKAQKTVSELCLDFKIELDFKEL